MNYVSPVGSLSLKLTEQGVERVEFVKKSGIKKSKEPSTTLEKEVLSWLQGYFYSSHHEAFPFKWLHFLQGTPFQKKVWKALWEIPFGEVVSYQWLAKKVGSPQGFRAVGNANGKNPLPLFIPCHRVIAADGSIGGYSCGLPIKRKLLRHEGREEFWR